MERLEVMERVLFFSFFLGRVFLSGPEPSAGPSFLDCPNCANRLIKQEERRLPRLPPPHRYSHMDDQTERRAGRTGKTCGQGLSGTWEAGYRRTEGEGVYATRRERIKEITVNRD